MATARQVLDHFKALGLGSPAPMATPSAPAVYSAPAATPTLAPAPVAPAPSVSASAPQAPAPSMSFNMSAPASPSVAAPSGGADNTKLFIGLGVALVAVLVLTSGRS
jgi:uncharacterized membrane protein